MDLVKVTRAPARLPGALEDRSPLLLRRDVTEVYELRPRAVGERERVAKPVRARGPSLRSRREGQVPTRLHLLAHCVRARRQTGERVVPRAIGDRYSANRAGEIDAPVRQTREKRADVLEYLPLNRRSPRCSRRLGTR